jgi:3-deoxy-D-manno-octulosonic-acid transferase
LWPVAVFFLIRTPKLRAGLVQKLGFYPPCQSLCRKDKLSSLETLPTADNRKRLWFHAVSVGELNAIQVLIRPLCKTFHVSISTTTKTAQDLARQTFPDLQTVYFPFDVPVIIQQAIRRIQPDMVLIAETELWPNVLSCLAAKRIPVVLINARLSERSFKRYQWIKPLMGYCLQQFSQLMVQSTPDAERFIALGAYSDCVMITGNLKFDIQPGLDMQKLESLRQLLAFQPASQVLTFASTHRGEEALLIDVYLTLKKNFPDLKLVLAPRHPDRLPEIEELLSRKEVPYSVRSRLTPEQPNLQDVVVLNTIGELLMVYSLSTVAVIGGSFVEHGGQNPLEPMSLGIPVVFGPYMANFATITQLVLANQAGIQVNSQTPLQPAEFQTVELQNILQHLLSSPETCQQMTDRAKTLLQQHQGSKQKLLELIEGYFC